MTNQQRRDIAWFLATCDDAITDAMGNVDPDHIVWQQWRARERSFRVVKQRLEKSMELTALPKLRKLKERRKEDPL